MWRVHELADIARPRATPGTAAAGPVNRSTERTLPPPPAAAERREQNSQGTELGCHEVPLLPPDAGDVLRWLPAPHTPRLFSSRSSPAADSTSCCKYLLEAAGYILYRQAGAVVYGGYFPRPPKHGSLRKSLYSVNVSETIPSRSSPAPHTLPLQ